MSEFQGLDEIRQSFVSAECVNKEDRLIECVCEEETADITYTFIDKSHVVLVLVLSFFFLSQTIVFHFPTRSFPFSSFFLFPFSFFCSAAADPKYTSNTLEPENRGNSFVLV